MRPGAPAGGRTREAAHRDRTRRGGAGPADPRPVAKGTEPRWDFSRRSGLNNHRRPGAAFPHGHDRRRRPRRICFALGLPASCSGAMYGGGLPLILPSSRGFVGAGLGAPSRLPKSEQACEARNRGRRRIFFRGAGFLSRMHDLEKRVRRARRPPHELRKHRAPWPTRAREDRLGDRGRRRKPRGAARHALESPPRTTGTSSALATTERVLHHVRDWLRANARPRARCLVRSASAEKFRLSRSVGNRQTLARPGSAERGEAITTSRGPARHSPARADSGDTNRDRGGANARTGSYHVVSAKLAHRTE